MMFPSFYTSPFLSLKINNNILIKKEKDKKRGLVILLVTFIHPPVPSGVTEPKHRSDCVLPSLRSLC